MAEARAALDAFRALRPDYSDMSNVHRFWELAIAAAKEEREARKTER